MESETIISYKLSYPLRDENRSLFANVTKNPWITPEGGIYNFIRLELKLNRGKNTNPISVSFTPTQFEWLIHKIENKGDSQLVPGEKEWKFICYERPDHFDDKIIIGVIDHNAKFGIVLDVCEQTEVVVYSEILLFVMKNQSARNEKLKDLVRFIHASILAEKIKSILKDDCIGCKEESLIHEEHICLKEMDEERLLEIFSRSLTLDDNKQKFMNLFDYYAAIMNINEIFKQEVHNMVLPIIIGEEKELFNAVKESFGLMEKSSMVKCINLLNERKKAMESMNVGSKPKRFCK
jgi:hypothetical protein